MADTKITDLSLSNVTFDNNPDTGQYWVDTDSNSTLVFNGSDWDEVQIKAESRMDRLEKMVEKIADRLAILDDPSPEKLEQFETLKDAYTKYKFVDGLCGPEEKKE